jgi:hypothetical protein
LLPAREAAARFFVTDAISFVMAGRAMSVSSEQRSPIVRFFETFFQEQNIKWMLGVGMLILIGSSLMLVTSHWDDYTPLWKSVILLAYMAGVHVAGQVSFHSLGLRKTGTVLMSLTVLLIPLSFHALRWNFAEGIVQQSTSLLLLAGNCTFATLAARRIFRHFLRSSQPTFVASYGILCVAATLLPLVPVGMAPWLALGLWSVFAVGAVKVNRHVFWLTEEHRLPRVCGFFPILLLGGQFLTLFATSLVDSTPLVDAIPVEWIGFGLVLTAIPVLLTVDALAKVFLEVHGEVTRPLPCEIVIPMLNGLALVGGGVCVSAIGFPHAVAVVPAAALAAVMLGVVGRRTGNPAFVWAMLVGILFAYQCSPVFFREFAGQIVQHGASAVHEQRLPIAFYGLTYFPLLAVLSLVARWRERAGDTVFAMPSRSFVAVAGAVLLAVSCTHIKAIFPVSLATVAVFTLQGILFRDRHLVVPGVAAWFLATVSCMPFLTDVLLVPESVELVWLTLSVGAGCLLFPGLLIDRRVARWPYATGPSSEPAAICQTTSLWGVTALAVAWLGSSFMTLFELWLWNSVVTLAAVANFSGGLIAVLLLSHAVRNRKRLTAEAAMAFTISFAAIVAFSMPSSIATTIALATSLLFALWSVAPRLRGRAFAIFGEAASRVAVAGFLAVFAVVLLPSWAASLADGYSFDIWVTSALATVWAIVAAHKYKSAWLVLLAWIAVLANAGVASVELLHPHVTHQWLPAIWGAMSLLAVLVNPRYRGELRSELAAAVEQGCRPHGQVVRRTLHNCSLTTLTLIATISLVFFTTPIRIAGLIALIGLLLIASRKQNSTMRTVSLMLVNWQVLCAVIQCYVPSVENVFELSLGMLSESAVPLALLASVLTLSWQYGLRTSRSAETSELSRIGLPATAELIWLQRALLRLVAATALVAVVFVSRNDTLSWHSVAMVALAFLTLAADCLVSAFRLSDSVTVSTGDEGGSSSAMKQSKARSAAQRLVWLTQLILAHGVLHLILCGVITIGNGISMFAVLGTGLLAWAISQLSARSPRTEFLSDPFSTTGQCLPAVTVAIGLGRHAFAGDAAWLGMNSLALLLAAGFYFWRGLERRSTALLTGSAVILNVALTLLWDELEFTDPQFFMIPLGISLLGLVELLRKEIPAKALNPLRYAAALVILVSPTFNIVGGSWLHLISLMVASVGVTLVAMGLRVRALMYTGVGFLVADLIAMLVRGSIDNPSILWIAGITIGTLVIGLAAYCEQHREKLLQRMRLVSSQLDAWD